MMPFSEMRAVTVPASYRAMGNALTLLLAMPEVIGPEERTVNSIYDDRIVATIDKEGFVLLGLLSIATVTALLFALICIYMATKDPRGRAVKVKSEPKYVIDMVANVTLGEEDFSRPSTVSDFGIALTWRSL